MSDGGGHAVHAARDDLEAVVQPPRHVGDVAREVQPCVEMLAGGFEAYVGAAVHHRWRLQGASARVRSCGRQVAAEDQAAENRGHLSIGELRHVPVGVRRGDQTGARTDGGFEQHLDQH